MTTEKYPRLLLRGEPTRTVMLNPERFCYAVALAGGGTQIAMTGAPVLEVDEGLEVVELLLSGEMAKPLPDDDERGR